MGNTRNRLVEIKGKHYLVVVDYYSRWTEIRNLTQTTSSHVIKELKDVFSAHGIPDTIQSDNGPQFASQEFSRFSIVYGFVHTTSSPYLSQANEDAERAVQTAKSLMITPDLSLALLV